MDPWSYYSSTSGFSNATGYNFAVHFDPLTPVPEPCTMLLVGSGLVGMVAYRRRIKKSITGSA